MLSWCPVCEVEPVELPVRYIDDRDDWVPSQTIGPMCIGCCFCKWPEPRGFVDLTLAEMIRRPIDYDVLDPNPCIVLGGQDG